jgi:hypothetical protein
MTTRGVIELMMIAAVIGVVFIIVGGWVFDVYAKRDRDRR